MAEGLLATHPSDETLAASVLTTLDTRKQAFAQILEVKIKQGYRIESQGDTEAVLFMRGRGHWFGLFGSSAGARQMISIDDQGTASTQKLSTGEAGASGSRKEPLGG